MFIWADNESFSPTHFPSVLSEGQPHGPDDLVCRASVEFDCCSSILPVCMYTVKKACAWLIFFPIQESVLYMFTKCLPHWFLWNCTGYGCSNKNMLAWAAWLFDDAVHHIALFLWASVSVNKRACIWYTPGFWLCVNMSCCHSHCVIICLDLEVWMSLPQSELHGYFSLHFLESLSETVSVKRNWARLWNWCILMGKVFLNGPNSSLVY